jgi:hypothetical protein
MAADDQVIYNGVSMRRNYAKSLESAQRLAFYRVGGRDIARLRVALQHGWAIPIYGEIPIYGIECIDGKGQLRVGSIQGSGESGQARH